MLKNFLVLTSLVLFSQVLNGQSKELLTEQFKTQINKALQLENRDKALSLALLASDYIDPTNKDFQRLLFELYYQPNTEEVFENEEGMEVTFSASDWSPDGKQLAVAVDDGSIRLYNRPFESYSILFSDAEMSILDIDFAPDGQHIAFSNGDGEIIIYGLGNEEIVHRWSHADYIRSVKWSHDGKMIAGGGDENTVFVYNLASKEQIGKFAGHSDWIRNISWSANDEWIATASDDNTASVWSVEKGDLVKTHTDHSDYCRDVAFSPKGNSLVTCSDDLSIFFYENGIDDASTKNYEAYDDEWVMALDWSQDGQYIASAGNSGSIVLFSTKNDEQLFFNAVEPETAWLDIDYSSDNQHFAVTSIEEVAIYKLGMATPIARLMFDNKTAPSSEGDTALETVLADKLPYAMQLSYSPDQTKLAIIDGEYNVEVLDMKTGESLFFITDHEDWVRNIDWSADGQYIATASDDMTAGIWSAETGEMVHLLSGHSDWVRDVDFSPDSKILLSVSDDGSTKGWDVATGEELTTTEESEYFLSYVDWSPQQTYFATQDSEGTLSIRQSKDNKQVFKSNPNTLGGSVVWVDDQNLTVLGAEGDAFNWNAKTGMNLNTTAALEASNESLTAKAKGPYISISGNGQSAFLQGHTQMILNMNWSPSGDYLLSFSADNKIGVWDIKKESIIGFIDNNTERMINKNVIWLDDHRFLTAGTPLITLPSSNVRQLIQAEDTTAPLSKEDIITYNLEALLLKDQTIVNTILEKADSSLLEAIAAFYDERAQSREAGKARALDESKAAQFKTAAEK